MGFEGALAAQLGSTPGNYVVSPASVLAGLAMAREGARGDTANAFDAVLGANARAIAKRLKPRSTVAIANRLFGDRALDVLREFLDITEREYAAPFELLDFANDPAASRRHINAWVAGATRDKIRELLDERDITTLTRLVLVDAIYLLAAWQTPFASTTPAPFAIEGGERVEVPTMRTLASARWGAFANATLLAVPYRDDALQMLVAVPARGSLAELEAAYAREGFAAMRAAVRRSGRAAIALPRFHAKTSIDLAKPLCAIGLAHAFGDDSDFTGIARGEPLQLSGVIHQAWIAVDEAGTEAAAATAVVMARGGGPPRHDATIDVDRSFLFFVHDTDDNVLFAGRVTDPRP